MALFPSAAICCRGPSKRGPRGSCRFSKPTQSPGKSISIKPGTRPERTVTRPARIWRSMSVRALRTWCRVSRIMGGIFGTAVLPLPIGVGPLDAFGCGGVDQQQYVAAERRDRDANHRRLKHDFVRRRIRRSRRRGHGRSLGEWRKLLFAESALRQHGQLRQLAQLTSSRRIRTLRRWPRPLAE